MLCSRTKLTEFFKEMRCNKAISKLRASIIIIIYGVDTPLYALACNLRAN